ncbi:MAG: nucleotidyl transferase AbiEii/AbiGii toxin family protein [Lentisphaeria bacterium]
MLCPETVDADALELLRQIQQNPLFAETRLVGGTALALQLGHRKSVDLDEPVAGDGLRLASYRDIAAMKLSAITNRGTKKDFVDLAFLLDQFSLNEMLAFYRRKYADASLFLVMKSLTYFDDAEEDPMPNMLKPCDWDDAKRRIIRAVVAEGENQEATGTRRPQP